MRKHVGVVVLGLAGLVPSVAVSMLSSSPDATVVSVRPAEAAATGGAAATVNAPVANAVSFLDTMDGAPTAPTPWRPGNWDVTVHSRNPAHFDNLEAMQAQHGPDCGAPPATHTMDTYEGAVFTCRNHMMTAIQDEWYGMIYLTPDHQVDFATGEAVISWDMSTLRKTPRDWPDVWITPFGDNLQLPLEDFLPDVSGAPRNSVHVTMGFDRPAGSDAFHAEIYRNFVREDLPRTGSTFASGGVVPDSARRDRFEIRISRTGLRVGMPQYNLWFVDTTFADLGWSRGVVQFGHHAYNPNKECFDASGTCGGGTWHWDNVGIAPAVPFTMLQADTRDARPADAVVNFTQPAPAGSFLRFAAIGKNMQVSFDGGASWQNAATQAHAKATAEEHFSQYWMPMPAGAGTVVLRGDNWWGGPWRARDFTVWADNGTPSPPGQSGPGGGAVATPLPTTSTYAPLNPSRLLDTRPGASTADEIAQGGGLSGPGAVIELQVAGRGGVPANAKAVTLNVTATGATANGFVTVWPCGEARPLASNLNYTAGIDVANAVLARLGAGGKVCLYNGAGATHLVADVNGFYPATSGYAALNPARLLDTRPGASTADGQGAGGGAVAPGQTVEVVVAGRGGAPADAAAAVLNVTSADGAGPGFVTVWPCGQPRPLASSLNFSPGRNVANAVLTRIGTGGRVCLSAGAAVTQLIVDVNGYFPTGTPFTALTPSRLLDTRAGASTVDGQAAGSGITQPGTTLQLQVGGRAGVPANANSVVLNVTSTGSTGAGFLTVWPCGQPRPLASNLNYSAGRDAANAVVSNVGAGGKVCIYTGAGATHLVADVTGYFPTDGTTAGIAAVAPGVSRLAGRAEELVCDLP